MAEFASLTREGIVGVVTVRNPPVNALSPGVPEAIVAALEDARGDEGIRAVVLIGEGRTFIAGADIREFVKMTRGHRGCKTGLDPLMMALEGFPKPVLAAMHGSALGGGLETAMACHYRIAADSALLGQPEVRLGLIPAAGGTQRLPRLVEIGRAIEMCASGNPVDTLKALEWGILDRVAQGDLLQEALAMARELAEAGMPPRRTRDLPPKVQGLTGAMDLIEAAREEAGRTARGQIAPLRAIDALEASMWLPFDDGLRREEELFEECLFSFQSKALIHLFFAERAAAKTPGFIGGEGSVGGRLLERCRSECDALVGEGRTPFEIRAAMDDFGIGEDSKLRPPGGEEAGVRGVQAETAVAIIERLVYALVLEAARHLEAREISCAADMDVLSIKALGFPGYRGGLMWYAAEVGLDRVAARIREFHGLYGDSWTPSPLLERLAAEGKGFGE